MTKIFLTAVVFLSIVASSASAQDIYAAAKRRATSKNFAAGNCLPCKVGVSARFTVTRSCI
ncbi:MAG: hypothetical protein IJ774_11895 [Selenomonadaceae bacterium]|nr:hypothetical protein [Selenomonadaceae bacterium]